MAAEAARELAVVTGASSGIGFQIAVALAQRDFDLVVSADDEQRLGRAAHWLAEQFPARSIIPVRADLSSADGAQHLYDAVARLQRPVSVLVNNAGVASGVRLPTAQT